jgi:N-acetylmuramoyl-L-alanine amidase/CARDB/Secretion system C-terminal sorting domain
MKNLLVTALLLASFCSNLPAQSSQADLRIRSNRQRLVLNEQLLESQNLQTGVLLTKALELDFTQPIDEFYTLALSWQGTVEQIVPSYRSKKRTGDWSAWQKLPVERHLDDENGVQSTELRFLAADQRFLQIKVEGGGDLPNIEIHLFNPVLPSTAERASIQQQPEPIELRGCPCPLPQSVSRSDWGAPGACGPPSTAAVTHLVVHHSAGVNTARNWAQVVLGIWDFHVNTRQYCDIAYNFLIDPNGVLYEGRGGGNNVIGAHFCSTNTGTMGVCLMGNYQEIEPSEQMMSKLEDILAWKSCNSNIDPLSNSFHARSNKVLNHICGHQDGCATECPGSNVYKRLATLRSNVAADIAACSTVPELANLERVSQKVEINDNKATFSLTIRNNGTAAATGFRVAYFAADNAAFNNPKLLGVDSLARLSANGTAQFSRSIDLCGRLNSGNFFLGFSIDDLKKVTESNEGDNGPFLFQDQAVTLNCRTTASKNLEDLGKNLLISPNPSQGSFWLKAPQGVQITKLQMLNQAGQMMPQMRFDGQNSQVDCPNLPTGMYWLRWMDQKQRVYWSKVGIVR